MRILAVDDDPIILELLKEFVNTVGGHHVETAESAVEALAIVSANEGNEFDCFFLDIQMPGTDGIELCEILRGIPAYKRAPMMMITAMTDKRYIDRAFAAGATDYVTKPFEITELRGRLALINGLVQERKANAVLNGAATGNAAFDPILSAVPLDEPFYIDDVENVIDYKAMSNYITKLSQSSLFGSTVFAFSIRKIELLHKIMTPYEFKGVISDVAEAIADCLQSCQFLVSYVGGGAFVCITEQGYRPDMEKLMDAVNLHLHDMDLHFSNGAPMRIKLSTGRSIRLVWRSGRGALSAVEMAHESAEEAARLHEAGKRDIFTEHMSA